MFNDIIGSVSDTLSHWGNSVSDFFSGYTSAHQAQRFGIANLGLQQMYNRENMALEDVYQRNLMADSPSIQRNALLNAGFNPLLAVGNGLSSPTSAVHASAPQMSMPTVSEKFSGILGTVSQAFGAYGQLASLASDIAFKDASAKAQNAQALSSSANAAKTIKETASMPAPKVAQENSTYGTSQFGKAALDGSRLLIDGVKDIGKMLKNSFGSSATSVRDDKKESSKTLNNVSTESAKALQDGIKSVEKKFKPSPRMRHETSPSRPIKSNKRRHN